ncbi:hypothetical protein J5T20_004480 [Escherichia coli]|nr:hypothetical protein [Escherichia coli]
MKTQPATGETYPKSDLFNKASLIISGNISFKDEHIIQLSGGAIKLGDVYKENKLISAKIIFPDNQGEQILVVDGNPENFKEDFQEKLNKVIKTLNASKKKDEEKVSLDNLSVIEESKLELVSAVRYSAQYVPMFTLTLDKKEITMPKNTVIFPFASDETSKYLNEQQQKYKDSLFLTR